MKVLSYNIQEGGGDRLARVGDVIWRARPDAVALQEVSNREHAAILARDLGMEMVIGDANIPFHIAWLSCLPIRRSENHRLPSLAKSLLEIEVEWLGESLRLFATHLASRHDRQTPVQEIPVILDILRQSSGIPHVLAGDFNALRPGDPVGRHPPGVQKRGEARDGAPRQTIQTILDAGYTDCYRAVHSSRTGYTYPSTAPWLRLDYIFASPGLAPRLRDCDVVDDPEAMRASDHRSIWADYEDSATPGIKG